MASISARERKFSMDTGDIAWLDNGACWICKEPESVPNRSLAVDHDHTTGAVRGFLCTRCNHVLGRMQDSPELLRTAADYLDQACMAFSDGCDDCLHADRGDTWINRPTTILETDGTYTRFAYRCVCGHQWACTHLTKGVPFAWRL